jgi:hypothetical protein
MKYQDADLGRDVTKKALIVDTRKGRPVYSANPSVQSPQDIGHLKPRKIGGVERGYIVSHSSGEMKIGGATFYQVERVDDERFVKLFLSGVRQTTGLTKPGLAMFAIVYEMMRQNPNGDRVELVFYTVSQVNPKMTERSFRRGLKELLHLNFVFDSPVPGLYFVNVTFMFNGDRMALVKVYERESASGRQAQMALEPPAADDAPLQSEPQRP